MNQVQGPSRECSQDQKKMGPETGLETRLPCGFKPIHETGQKTELEINYHLHLRSIQETSYLQHSSKVYLTEAPLLHHSGKDRRTGPEFKCGSWSHGQTVGWEAKVRLVRAIRPFSIQGGPDVGLCPVVGVMLLPFVSYLTAAHSSLHCQKLLLSNHMGTPSNLGGCLSSSI